MSDELKAAALLQEQRIAAGGPRPLEHGCTTRSTGASAGGSQGLYKSLLLAYSPQLLAEGALTALCTRPSSGQQSADHVELRDVTRQQSSAAGTNKNIHHL